MSLRTALLRPPLRRIASRRVCTATGSAQTSPSKGPKLPVGNDPAAFHDQQHALGMNSAPLSKSQIYLILRIAPISNLPHGKLVLSVKNGCAARS